MVPVVRQFVASVAGQCGGPVLEVGSYRVPGQEEIADLRPFFEGMDYLGVDLRHGLGVDEIADVHRLRFPDASLGTVICLETLEHVHEPVMAVRELRRVLRPRGIFIFSAPFHFPIHEHPADYWRFTPQCWREILLEGFTSVVVVEAPDNSLTPQHVMGWAVK